jgi:hypothetical protein
MLKNTFRILIIGITLFIILPGTSVTAGYKAAKITYVISGSVGVSGVVMNGLPGNPVTNENGYYTATVEYGWSGTVTPTKEGYTFEPDNKTYAKVTSEQANQSYTATLITFTISGTAGQVTQLLMQTASTLPLSTMASAAQLLQQGKDISSSRLIRNILLLPRTR